MVVRIVLSPGLLSCERRIIFVGDWAGKGFGDHGQTGLQEIVRVSGARVRGCR